MEKKAIMSGIEVHGMGLFGLMFDIKLNEDELEEIKKGIGKWHNVKFICKE